jgi:hypothetical protein
MKLIIEVDVTDCEEEALDFIKESRLATSINLEVGRPIISKNNVFRMCGISSEYFKIKKENTCAQS